MNLINLSNDILYLIGNIVIKKRTFNILKRRLHLYKIRNATKIGLDLAELTGYKKWYISKVNPVRLTLNRILNYEIDRSFRSKYYLGGFELISDCVDSDHGLSLLYHNSSNHLRLITEEIKKGGGWNNYLDIRSKIIIAYRHNNLSYIDLNKKIIYYYLLNYKEI